MKTYSQKPVEIERKWIQIDASDATLGRVCTQIAKYLVGKYKPTYTAHIDGGDYVIVLNSNKLAVTGNKMIDKKYYRHSGFPGGIKERSLKEQMSLDSTKVIADAVRGMLPKNKLLDGRMQRLKVYTGADHPHAPQQPVIVKVEE